MQQRRTVPCPRPSTVVSAGWLEGARKWMSWLTEGRQCLCRIMAGRGRSATGHMRTTLANRARSLEVRVGSRHTNMQASARVLRWGGDSASSRGQFLSETAQALVVSSWIRSQELQIMPPVAIGPTLSSVVGVMISASLVARSVHILAPLGRASLETRAKACPQLTVAYLEAQPWCPRALESRT